LLVRGGIGAYTGVQAAEKADAKGNPQPRHGCVRPSGPAASFGGRSLPIAHRTDSQPEPNRRKQVTILIAEDDDDDFLLAEDALRDGRIVNRLERVSDGQQLLDYLRGENGFADRDQFPFPSLLLLDLNMPKLDGREALAAIKGDPDLRALPVVVMTTSRDEEDVMRSYDMGVSSFIRKPVTFEQFVNVVKVFGQYWLEVVELPPTRGT
jgi:two-component system response regulator